MGPGVGTRQLGELGELAPGVGTRELRELGPESWDRRKLGPESWDQRVGTRSWDGNPLEMGQDS